MLFQQYTSYKFRTALYAKKTTRYSNKAAHLQMCRFFCVYVCEGERQYRSLSFGKSQLFTSATYWPMASVMTV